jgi:hypothetical protein
MNKKIIVLTLTFVLLCSVVPLAVIPVKAADVTTSITVTKLANDGTTVLDQVTIAVEDMMTELPVYGDGVTHYYFQGPTFDPENIWDPEEMVNIDSRDYGACMGTDVKDLCELAGGASPGDEIKIKSPDGFNKMFAYEDVYNPEPEQGKLIITWYTKDTADGITGSVTDGSYTTGMRLIFFAETTNPDGKHVFGIWDMHETLAEKYWHYYQYPDSPSSSGLSVKWVNEIIIYSSEEPTPPETWSLTLTGADTYVMDQTEFEDGVECHGATWVDDTDTWSGIPLWRLVGYVDDDVQHGEGAFNDAMAAAGYDVQVIASDGYSKTFASADVARNDNMIVANTLNGEELDIDRYPLRLVGPDLSGGQKVAMIQEIQLVGLPELPEEGASDSLNATANVIIEMVGIDLDRDSIDYGDVAPGDSSAVEPVGIDNIGTLDCDVTLEVNGADATAQSFYEQSLYVDGGLYNSDAVIANIPVAGSESVDTQLQVPLSWAEGTGAQDATFIFWASASD